VIVSTPTDWTPFAFDRTDADGVLMCNDVPDRRVRVAVETTYGEPDPWEDDGWATPVEERLVRPGGGEVTLVFEEGRPLRGRVEFPESYPRSPRPEMLAPRALVNVEKDGVVLARAYTGEDRRFTAWVPASARGPFRLTAGLMDSQTRRSFDAEALEVPSDAQDAVLSLAESKR
jgi:hypothetical protein